MKKYVISAQLLSNMILTKDEEFAKKIKLFLKKNANCLYSSEFLRTDLSSELISKLNDEEKIEIYYNKLLEIPIKFIQVDPPILKKARKIAVRKNLDLNTAIYHATAIAREYEFVCLDQKYFNKVSEEFGNISLLKK